IRAPLVAGEARRRSRGGPDYNGDCVTLGPFGQAHSRARGAPRAGEAEMSVGSILSQAALRWPNRPALVDEHGTLLKYAQWNARINRLTRVLRRLGVRHGDRVAFCLRNVEALASS